MTKDDKMKDEIKWIELQFIKRYPYDKIKRILDMYVLSKLIPLYI